MLALISGRGGLPAAVAAALTTRPVVAALKGQSPEALKPDITFRIEHLGTLLHSLTVMGVTELCFCGAIDRAVIALDEVDAATQPLLPVLLRAVAAGEDAALRAVVGLFEDAGFAIRAAQALAPNLLPSGGVLTAAGMPAQTHADVEAALRVLDLQAGRDMGQACVIQNGVVRAREDAGGTDAMLDGLGRATERATGASDNPLSGMFDLAGDMLGNAADWLSGDAAQGSARAGILFKAPRPGQDLRFDVPTIGPATAERAVAAGLAGIVIARDGVIVLDQARVLDILDAAGLFIWVR